MTGSGPDVVIEPLDRTHDRAAFASGDPHLDRYLKRQANQDSRRDVAQTYVAVETSGPAVIGYYTLSAYAVEDGEIPEDIATKLPRYDRIPAALIGRLAVDRRYRGHGLGKRLLMDALFRCVQLSTELGLFAVVVDAKDEAAKAFYQRYDFQPFPSRELKLFLPIKTAERAFRS